MPYRSSPFPALGSYVNHIGSNRIHARRATTKLRSFSTCYLLRQQVASLEHAVARDNAARSCAPITTPNHEHFRQSMNLGWDPNTRRPRWWMFVWNSLTNKRRCSSRHVCSAMFSASTRHVVVSRRHSHLLVPARRCVTCSRTAACGVVACLAFRPPVKHVPV